MRSSPLLLLCAVGAAFGQTLPQDRLRTGMVEAGLRAWSVTLSDRGSERTATLVGGSIARFVTDNISVGALFASENGRSPLDAFCLDATARAYFFPLQRSTPWMELRVGGRIQPSLGSGATHLGAGFGWRWRPLTRLALDLQVAGIERWGYDDPSEYTNGTADWTMQKSPLAIPWGDDGFRLWLVPSIHFLF